MLERHRFSPAQFVSSTVRAPVMEQDERWLPAPGYAGWYEVSDLGKVTSLPRAGTRGGPVAVYPNSRGYPCVTLSRYGRTRTIPVAALVLGAFDSPGRGRRVRYGPGGKADVSLANLAWR